MLRTVSAEGSRTVSEGRVVRGRMMRQGDAFITATEDLLSVLVDSCWVYKAKYGPGGEKGSPVIYQ